MAITASYIDNSYKRIADQRAWLENDLASFKNESDLKLKNKEVKWAEHYSASEVAQKIEAQQIREDEALEKRRIRYETIIAKNKAHFLKKNGQLTRKKDKLARKLALDKTANPDDYAKKEALIESNIAKKAKAVEREDTRIFEIDLIRGIIIWGMIFDHFLGNFWYLYPYIFNYNAPGANSAWLQTMWSFSYNDYWPNPVRCSFRFVGLMLLLVLCGISCHLSRSNWKRGLMVFSFGVVVTACLNFFSCITGQDEWCFFGTLTCIGSCILIYTFMRWVCKSFYHLWEKERYRHKKYDSINLDENKKLILTENPPIWKWISLILFAGLFTLSACTSLTTCSSNANIATDWWRIINGDGNFVGWIRGNLSVINGDNWYEIVFGQTGYGSDWLGLLPYLAYIFLGGFIGETLYKDKKSVFKYCFSKEDREIPDYFFSKSGRLNADLNKAFYPVSYLGKNTIWVYILHQPIFIIVMSIIIMLCGVPLTIF